MPLALVVAIAVVAVQPAELIDRTLAIVGGRVITLSDARTALALGLVEGAEVNADVVRGLVDRDLMLREAERYDPPEPGLSAIDARLEAITARAGGEEAVSRLLSAGGFVPGRLRAWIRDDLRVAAYLQQRFAADERRADLIADWVSDLRRRTPITLIDP